MLKKRHSRLLGGTGRSNVWSHLEKVKLNPKSVTALIIYISPDQPCAYPAPAQMRPGSVVI
jgi:hypothetical protein